MQLIAYRKWRGRNKFLPPPQKAYLNMKKLLLIAVLFSASFASFAQYHGHPTYHDDYSNLYIMGGYQYLSHPTGVYQVGTVQAEILFSFFSSRIGFAVGPEYTSFSPFGIFLFAPRIFASTLQAIPRSSRLCLSPFRLGNGVSL